MSDETITDRHGCEPDVYLIGPRCTTQAGTNGVARAAMAAGAWQDRSYRIEVVV